LGKGACYLKVKNTFSSDYVYYVLQSPNFKNYIHSMATGSTIKHISLQTMRNYKFFYPPLETQKKIAAVLSALDDKIELNNKINKNLEQQAQIFYKITCQDSKFFPLSEIIESIESGSRQKGGAKIFGIPSIGAEKIEKFGIYDYSQEKFISEDYFQKMKRGIVKSGDVMLYKDGAYTGKTSMAFNGFPYKICAVNEHVFLIRTKNKEFQFFLYFTLQNEIVRKKIFSLASSKAAQPGLNQKELLSVEIPLPKKEMIKNFESEIFPHMQMIALNALENKKLAEMRDLLLPRLLNGEIDVSKVEI